MSAARSPQASDWRELASFGEQLLGTSSLSAQRDRIVRMTQRLVGGQVQVWLHEKLFRLPDSKGKALFPTEPPLAGMQAAFRSGVVYSHSHGQVDSDPGACVAVPLTDQGLTLGVLQIGRPKGPDFTADELELLEAVAGIVTVALIASHRVAVERWRIGQLNLVRDVSSQVVNVLDLDKLTSRVTKLIQKTFHYYYVAVFTREPDSHVLRFRASAKASRKGRNKASVALEVEVGQGLIGSVAQNGDEILCDDVKAETRFRFIDSLPETQSEVVLPLKIEDRVLGVLDIQSDQLRAFHPYDLLVLRALADNIARAVDGARLYNDLARRAEQLEVIAEVSDSVTSSLDLKGLMRDAATLIHERFGYPHVQMYTVHPNRRLIEFEAGSGVRSDQLEGFALPLDDSQGVIPWAARHGKTILLNDVRQDPRYRPSHLPPKNTKSELAVPLIFDEQVVGILDIQSDKLNAFGDDDRIIFEALADNIATAIHNADLYSSEQWRRQVADSLREVAVLLSANVGVEEVLDTILTELERNLSSDVTAIWLVDDDELYPAAVHGCDPLALEKARRESADASITLTSILLTDKPVIRQPDEPPGPAGLAAGFDGNYSAISAPLRIGDQAVGVLTLAHSTPGRYGHEAQAMTTTFASYAAVAIENTRLYDAAQEQAYASAALLQVAQAVVSLSDLDEILGTIVRIMPILVGIERCLIYLWDEATETFYPVQSYGIPDEADAALWREEYAPGDFPLLDAVRQGERLLLQGLQPGTDPATWIKLAGPWSEEENLMLHGDGQLLLGVPLSIKNDMYGVMLVEEAEGGRRFRNRRMEIITGIAQQAALGIQNDLLQREMVVRERLETEVQLARQIQQTFIPDHLPEYPGWGMAARWRTARQVGGDFYDVFELPNGHLGLFIADVADKGVPAALFMALTRTLVRAAVAETESPARVLSRVNELLIPDTEQGMFVTAAYAVLDTSSGALTYANAGHNPPLWVSKNEHKIVRLTRTGVALGALEGMKIDERTIQLQSGDYILFFTDGLNESFSPEGEQFGEERIHQELLACDDDSPQEIIEEIEEALDEFVGGLPPADDLTMLVLKNIG
jgi:sigma-B regulation protein RsbU (phosphoserine phosphatase)